MNQNEIEWLKCSQSVEYFAQTYVKIQDRTKTDTIPFEPWEYLIDLLKTFGTERLIWILKARQLGISWLVVIYCLWKAKFSRNAKILLLSQGEAEAYDLLSKARFIDDHLPDFLRTKRDPDQRGFFSFPDTGSELVALPSTEKAGRSTDATIVVCDEEEFHPYAEKNFSALKPTIDSRGQFIGLSTADKTRMNSFFKEKYLEAKTHTSNFKAIFLPYHLRPGRDEAWYERTSKDYKSWQMEQEYPKTEEEALSTLKSIPFFNLEAISEMKGDLMQPIKHDLTTKYSGMVCIYRLPVVGRRYVQFTDPSDGKEDPHAIVVMDARTGEEVASSHGMIPADRVAVIHDELVRLYNSFNTYELNARAGGIFTEKFKELSTPNQAPFYNADGKVSERNKEKTGWWTSDKVKDKMLWELEEAVRMRQIIPHRRDSLEEFERYMMPEGQDPQPPAGGHDDWIIAWGGAWQLRKHIPQEAGEVKSYAYKRK